MKLTLGQAAKEVGISKPSLSAAIKKGKLSAHKNEYGVYEIDPSELFRVYEPKANTNGVNKQETLTTPNPVNEQGKGVENELLGQLLAEKERLIEEKNESIKRLEDEKNAIREDLEAQRAQTTKLTLLLENHSKKESGDDWRTAINDMKREIANQDRENKEEREKVLKQNRALKQALDAEKNKSFWQRLFG